MREFSLSPRLAVCASFVRKGSVVADIGTDHALLPVWLVREGVASRAIASDINEGPIARARLNIQQHDMGHAVTTVVANGLAGIAPGQADDIVIAGMGGDLIAAILSAAEWIKDGDIRLILQPMSHAERLREYLFTTGFEVTEEQAVIDAGRVYSVMCAHYTGATQSDEVMLYGGLLVGRTDEASREYLERVASSLRAKATGLRQAGEEEAAQQAEKVADALLK